MAAGVHERRQRTVGLTNDDQGQAVDRLPDHLFTLGFTMIGVSLVILVLAQYVFSKLEKQIPERI